MNEAAAVFYLESKSEHLQGAVILLFLVKH